jgi:hypothetical protein
MRSWMVPRTKRVYELPKSRSSFLSCFVACIASADRDRFDQPVPEANDQSGERGEPDGQLPGLRSAGRQLNRGTSRIPLELTVDVHPLHLRDVELSFQSVQGLPCRVVKRRETLRVRDAGVGLVRRTFGSPPAAHPLPRESL